MISDLHAELAPRALPPPEAVATGADIVVVAGDVARAPDAVSTTRRLFPEAQVVVQVAGNHEHYRTRITIDDGLRIMKRAADEASFAEGRQIIFLEDHERTVVVHGVPVKLLGATLWTDYALFGHPEIHARVCAAALNDHRLICGDASTYGLFFGSACLTPKELIHRHRASRAFLSARLGRRHAGPVIVVTHHLPSLRSVAFRFKTDPISAAFASNLDDLLAADATLWVHGHTHDSCAYRAGRTLVICNPAGYALSDGGRANPDFKPRLIVEISQRSDGSWSAACPGVS